jgi:SAM-dependent methyltransferase
VTRINAQAAAGFSAAADEYERARPSYPDDAVAFVVERAGLHPGRTVVDVGAGTGKLTRLLVPSGARVIAAEPVAEMRAKLEEAAPKAEAVDATAEELPLADGAADAVTVAQAFHWFDHDRALPELHRVLRPGGLLVLVWNMRDTSDPLQHELEQILRPLRNVPYGAEDGGWRSVLEASPLFGAVEERRFCYVQTFRVPDLLDRVASTSFVAAMGEEERAEVLDRVRGLVADVAEPFDFPYVTEVDVVPRLDVA